MKMLYRDRYLKRYMMVEMSIESVKSETASRKLGRALVIERRALPCLGSLSGLAPFGDTTPPCRLLSLRFECPKKAANAGHR